MKLIQKMIFKTTIFYCSENQLKPNSKHRNNRSCGMDNYRYSFEGRKIQE